MTVMAVVGSTGRQAIVTRLGFRSVAVMGLALTGGPNRLLAFTERFQAAFTAAIVFQAVGLACAILLLGKVAAPPPLVPETAPAPDVLLRHPAPYLAAHRCFPCKAALFAVTGRPAALA